MTSFALHEYARNLVLTVAEIAVLAACDPHHWVGVQATLKEPMSPDCVLDALRNIEEIGTVSDLSLERTTVGREIYGPVEERDLFRYAVLAKELTTRDRIPLYGRVVLSQDDRGQVHFRSYFISVFMYPPFIEKQQAFFARVAGAVAKSCRATFHERDGFICVPSTSACTKALFDSGSR